MMKEQAIRNVVHLGEVRYRAERYTTEYLKPVSKDSLERDWYGSIYLLLSTSFYQARLDEVSSKVEKAAMAVLDGHFNGRDFSALTGCDFVSLKGDLLAVIGKGKVGKARDAEMVVEILRFVSQLPGENLTCYSVTEIERGDIKKLYNDLMGIRGIGPKIASLYLRDLVDIYNLESKIAAEDLPLLQPIDVWVRRVARKTGIVDNEQLADVDIQKDIVRVCRELGISALRFNQGAWYLGKNAFEILVDKLDSIQLP
jgi:endonuclease III